MYRCKQFSAPLYFVTERRLVSPLEPALYFTQAHAELVSLRNDLWNHSPTGAGWGYGGSGPAQLALGIAAHFLAGEGARFVFVPDSPEYEYATGKLAAEHYAIETRQALKWRLIAPAPQREPFELRLEALFDFSEDIAATDARRAPR